MHISSLILYLSHSYSPGPSSYLVTPILAMPILIIRVWYKCGPLHESVSYNAACRLLQFGLNQSWKPRKDFFYPFSVLLLSVSYSFAIPSFSYPFSVFSSDSTHFLMLLPNQNLIFWWCYLTKIATQLLRSNTLRIFWDGEILEGYWGNRHKNVMKNTGCLITLVSSVRGQGI